MYSNHELFQQAESALLGEKAKKLFGLAKFLDSCLGDNFAIEPGTSKTTNLEAMNAALSPVVDQVCASFQGLGAGYYSKELDCIIVYGPTSQYGDKTGISIAQDHVGRRCMETSRPVMAVGSLVRGEVMNCVYPVIRNEVVIGFVWANETVEDIYAQLAQGGMDIFLSPDIELLLGLSGLVMMGCRTLLTEDNTSAILQRYIRFFLNCHQFRIILADEMGVVRFVSKNLEGVGLEPDTFLDRLAEEIFSALGLKDWQTMLEKLRASGGTYQFDTLPLGPKQMEMNVGIAALIDDGEWLGFVTFLQDKTAVQRERETLYRAEAVHYVEQLAVAMIHEVRNPLTILREAIRIIPRRLEDKQYLQKFTEVALAEINHVERLTNSLSELTRYSLPEFLKFNIVEMVSKAIDLVRGMAEEQKVSIEENYAVLESIIYGDPEHLHQAILNLLLNSLQAMPEGGILSVSINEGTDQKLVYIKIKDTGHGIKPEMEKAIFRPFYTTKANGTGLGLSLVQSIITRHSGFLSLEPGSGSGAVFSISIPRQRVLKWIGLKGEHSDEG